MLTVMTALRAPSGRKTPKLSIGGPLPQKVDISSEVGGIVSIARNLKPLGRDHPGWPTEARHSGTKLWTAAAHPPVD